MRDVYAKLKKLGANMHNKARRQRLAENAGRLQSVRLFGNTSEPVRHLCGRGRQTQGFSNRHIPPAFRGIVKKLVARMPCRARSSV